MKARPTTPRWLQYCVDNYDIYFFNYKIKMGEQPARDRAQKQQQINNDGSNAVSAPTSHSCAEFPLLNTRLVRSFNHQTPRRLGTNCTVHILQHSAIQQGPFLHWPTASSSQQCKALRRIRWSPGRPRVLREASGRYRAVHECC